MDVLNLILYPNEGGGGGGGGGGRPHNVRNPHWAYTTSRKHIFLNSVTWFSGHQMTVLFALISPQRISRGFGWLLKKTSSARRFLLYQYNICSTIPPLLTKAYIYAPYQKKNIERHTAHTIISWPNHKQWVIFHTSDLMMMIRQSIYILSIITREMGKLKTHSPTYCIVDNWENMLNLTHTLDKIYPTGIL